MNAERRVGKWPPEDSSTYRSEEWPVRLSGEPRRVKKVPKGGSNQLCPELRRGLAKKRTGLNTRWRCGGGDNSGDKRLMEFLREGTEWGDRETIVKLSRKAEKRRSGWEESQGQQGTRSQVLSRAHLKLTALLSAQSHPSPC